MALRHIDVEKSAILEDGTFVVNSELFDQKDRASTTESDASRRERRTADDGKTILIPQPSQDPDDPLNWSWAKKHTVMVALLSGALLTDWGMTWGVTLFEVQALDWNMPITAVAASASGGIFLQGPGGVFAVPLIQRYGRLPVLFWSQVLSCIMVIAAVFAPTYAGFTAARTLQGFFNTAPQVIGLSMIHDMFYFHERARKINLWAFSFLVGPYLGPFISGFIIQAVSWRADFAVLAGFYALSALIVIFCGQETLYDRENPQKNPTGLKGRVELLVGIAGYRAVRRPSLWTVTKDLASISILPQLLLPTGVYIMMTTMWTIGITTTVTQFVKPPPYLFSDTATALLYLAPMIGSVGGEVFGHFFNDWLCNRYIRTHNGVYKQENRLWGTWPATALAITALVLYGQTLQHELSWVGLAIGWGLESFAVLSGTVAISAYVLDCFPDHAALASSWINFWRTTGGFCVTYFQAKWVAQDGAGIAFGCQAALQGAAFLAIIVTQLVGHKWRARYLPPAAEN